jgi:hypothetical protein
VIASDWWELLLVVLANVVSFVAVAAVVLFALPSWALLLAFLPAFLVLIGMPIAGTIETARALLQLPGDQRRIAHDQLSRHHHLLVLAHATTASDARRLHRKLLELSRQHPEHGSAPSLTLCPATAVSSPTLLGALQAGPRATWSPAAQLVVLGNRRASVTPSSTTSTDTRAQRLLRAAASTLAATIAGIAGFAHYVAESEAAACAGGSCDGKPVTTGDAFYWLINRFLGGDPDGLGAGSVLGRYIGLGFTILGFVVLGGAVAAAVNALTTTTETRGVVLAHQLDQSRNRQMINRSASHRSRDLPSAPATRPRRARA